MDPARIKTDNLSVFRESPRPPAPGVTFPALPREPTARYEALVAIASAVVEQFGEVTARALAAAIDEAAADAHG